ncbi:MAG: hypothetical protein KGL95_03300, partial [Patescibacteria group bacterium]|nr:hypothetical protein [Patescibacteria group bacterium]
MEQQRLLRVVPQESEHSSPKHIAVHFIAHPHRGVVSPVFSTALQDALAQRAAHPGTKVILASWEPQEYIDRMYRKFSDTSSFAVPKPEADDRRGQYYYAMAMLLKGTGLDELYSINIPKNNPAIASVAATGNQNRGDCSSL